MALGHFTEVGHTIVLFGVASFVKNNILYGPNLIDIYDNNYYYITPLLTYESIIDKLDIVKKETNIKLQDLFEEILLQTN